MARKKKSAKRAKGKKVCRYVPAGKKIKLVNRKKASRKKKTAKRRKR